MSIHYEWLLKSITAASLVSHNIAQKWQYAFDQACFLAIICVNITLNRNECIMKRE